MINHVECRSILVIFNLELIPVQRHHFYFSDHSFFQKPNIIEFNFDSSKEGQQLDSATVEIGTQRDQQCSEILFIILERLFAKFFVALSFKSFSC